MKRCSTGLRCALDFSLSSVATSGYVWPICYFQFLDIQKFQTDVQINRQ